MNVLRFTAIPVAIALTCPAPATAQTTADLLRQVVSDGRNLPVATQTVILQTLRAQDPRGYEHARDELMRTAGLSHPDSITAYLGSFQRRYDALQGVLRGNRPRMELPSIDSAAYGPTNMVTGLRRSLAHNPVEQLVDTIFQLATADAVAQTLRSDPAALRQFAQLALTGEQPAPLTQAEQVLTERTLNSSDYRALDPGQRLRVLRSIQVGVQRLVAEGPDALERAGAQAAAATEQEVAETVQTLTGAIRLADRVSTLQAEAFLRLVSAERRMNRALQAADRELILPGTLLPGDFGGLQADASGFHLLASALRLPDPVTRLTGHVERFQGLARDAQRFKQIHDEILASQQDVLGAANHYLGGASQMLASGEQFLDGLGIKPQVVSRVRVVLETAQKVAGIGAAIASQNYVGAVMGVVDLVGGFMGGPPGPDIETLRYESMMRAFEQLGQAMETMVEMQRATLEQLDRMDQKLDSMAVRMARNHAEVMVKLDEINRNQLWLASIVTADQRLSLQDCRDLAEVYTRGRYEHKEVFVNSVHTSRCRSVLASNTPETPGGLDNTPMLWLKTRDASLAAQQGTEVTSYEAEVWRPLLQYFDRWRARPDNVFLTGERQQRVRNALTRPAIVRDSLTAKLRQLRDPALAPPDPPHSPGVPAVALAQPLSDSLVAQLAERVLDLHPVQILIANDDELVARNVFFDPGTLAQAKNLGEKELLSVAATLDAAIAFETLLGGDLMLPALAVDVDQPDVLKVLDKNGVLAINVAREILYERADASCPPEARRAPSFVLDPTLCVVSPDVYAQALASQTADSLVRLTRRPGRADRTFAGGPGSWTLRVGDSQVPLPNVEEFRRREYLVTSGLQRLWLVRDTVFHALAAHYFRTGVGSARRLNDRENEVLSHLLMFR